MPMKVELPQVGESVTEGIIGKWLKKVGDRVEKYEPLAEIVTDKVTMELPSPETGVLTAILAKEGDTVPMGAAIAEMEPEGAARKEAPPMAIGAAPIGTTGVLLHEAYAMGPTGTPGPEGRLPVQEAAPSEQKQRHSPAVSRLAQEQNVDLLQVKGTGLGGRVTREDVLSYVEARAKAQAVPTTAAPARPPVAASRLVGAGPDEEVLPLTPVRRMIADNMVKSATQIPQAWSATEVDVTGLVQVRESAKEEFQRREGVPLTYLPFVVKAVGECLKENPLLNSTWGGDKITLKKRINIGIAVAAPQGLTVPVIHDANGKSIAALAKAIADLTNRGRNGKLTLQDVQGGTFTVNNTGALGSVLSRPLISPPQAAILTTEAIVKRPVVFNDAIAIRSVMNVCLVFDHRVMDGSEAGKFMNDLKARLEAIGPKTALY